MSKKLNKVPKPAADSEQRILAAAHQVFLRTGTGHARMQDIADEAGVNKALLHYYFRSKQKLVERVYLSTASQLFPSIFRTLASEMPLRDKVVALVTKQLDTLNANPYIPGYLVSEFHYNKEGITAALASVMPPIEEREQMFATVQRQLDSAATAGEIRPTRAYDFILTIMSQLIFPVVSAPMIDFIWNTGDAEREAFFDRQRHTLADRVMASLRPALS